jgi:tetratricopeptide (TPR) repeat protein
LARFAEAIKDYSIAISINPDVPKFYYNRGTAFTERGLFKDAVYDFSKAILISTEPKAEYYSKRGLALIKLGRLEEGKRDLNKAKKVGK